MTDGRERERAPVEGIAEAPRLVRLEPAEDCDCKEGQGCGWGSVEVLRLEYLAVTVGYGRATVEAMKTVIRRGWVTMGGGIR